MLWAMFGGRDVPLPPMGAAAVGTGGLELDKHTRNWVLYAKCESPMEWVRFIFCWHVASGVKKSCVAAISDYALISPLFNPRYQLVSRPHSCLRQIGFPPQLPCRYRKIHVYGGGLHLFSLCCIRDTDVDYARNCSGWNQTQLAWHVVVMVTISWMSELH